MHYSFSSVYMAIIASNVLLILLTLCFRNKKIMVNAGYKMLLVFVYCTLLRFLFPFELPFSRNVLLPESLSFVVSRVHLPLFIVSNFYFSIWILLLVIWTIGFFIQLAKHIKISKKFKYDILSSSLNITENEPYHSLVEQICKEKGKRNRFEIFEVTEIAVPMLYGVFSPKILIPAEWEVTSEYLYYVLTHEISHHFHHDLVIKNLVNLLAMVYWWNPFCHLLVRQTTIILEMRIDDKITQSDAQTTAEYLHCLIEIAEKAVASNQEIIPDTLTISFSDNTKELTKRFVMLTESGKQKHHSWNIALAILMFGIYILSYLYIFEAHYISPEKEFTSIDLIESNTYAIQNENGSYDIYYDNYFLETVDSLEYYLGIPIYTKEKENNNEKN